MWIKICANTTVDDALLAAELGAHALGFVFAPSSRRVTSPAVAAITRQLPAHVERIGVFQTQDGNEIARTIDEAGLTGAQLHGEFDLNLVAKLRRIFGEQLAITQTIHWDTKPGTPEPGEVLARQMQLIRQETQLERVLIDSRFGAASGGSGVAFDWPSVAAVLTANRGDLKLIVAGGLSAGNVVEAIRTLNPWGVDVATGVEESPGKKDPKKLKAFIMKALL